MAGRGTWFPAGPAARILSVTGAELEPDYVPDHVRAWARRQRDLLELVVEELLRSGTWPVLSDLTRKLAGEGRPVPLRTVFWEMPKSLGRIEPNPERVRLTVFGLRLTSAGRPLLGGFLAVLRLAVERYPKGTGEAVVRKHDLGGVVEADLVDVLSDVVYSEAPFLRAFQGGPEDEWVCPIDDSVVNYWNAATPDDYLRIRADEMRRSPQFGWGTTSLADAEASPLAYDEDEVLLASVEAGPGGELVMEVGVARGEREWQIGERIGRGGFGQVFAATSGEDEGVIKLVAKDPGADRELLFADLDGVPNVVPVWDRGECGGYWFIVMPRAGRSLKDLLDEHGSLPVDESVVILTDISDALAALDGRVVHRDLKPANVLELDGRWCLADFGIARYAEATTAAETRKHALSAQYAAPERWRGERATAAADVYSLGVIGYELLSGAPPFDGSTWEEFQEAHLHQQPPDLENAPALLAALITECLYKSPGARPTTENLRARLDRVAQPPVSPGLARLSDANRGEVQRLSRAGPDQAAAMTAAERRQLLIRDANRAYARISDALFGALVEAAPAAQARRDPDVGNWRVELAHARLEMSGVGEPTNGWNAAGLFDLVLVGGIVVRIPTDRYGYGGRSHSLWFADAQHEGEYLWFETGFTLMAMMATTTDLEPFALNGGKDAEMALRVGMHTHQIAWPFTPLRIGDLEDFIGRWAGWLAEAADGRLQRVPGGNAQALGSWRRS